MNAGETVAYSGMNYVADTITKALAPAKINWNLRILGKREDGFHELESLVSTVTLYDELSFTPRKDSIIELTCNNSDIPVDQNNLIYQAASLLAAKSGTPYGGNMPANQKNPCRRGGWEAAAQMPQLP